MIETTTPPWDIIDTPGWHPLPGGGYARNPNAAATTALDQVDDGTREFAVAQLGDEAIRQLEIDIVKQYAHLGIDLLARLGIPQDSIRAALQ